MKSWSRAVRTLGVIAAVAVAFGACDEQLDSGGACPSLCPQPSGQIRDTTFVAIALDTSIAGFPTQGLETELYIASLQDTLQTRGVIRFDSLPKTFRHNNTAVDSAIVAIDTGSVLRVYVAVPEKYFTPESALVVHEASCGMTIDGGAPNPGANATRHGPSSVASVVRVTAGSTRASVGIARRNTTKKASCSVIGSRTRVRVLSTAYDASSTRPVSGRQISGARPATRKRTSSSTGRSAELVT